MDVPFKLASNTKSAEPKTPKKSTSTDNINDQGNFNVENNEIHEMFFIKPKICYVCVLLVSGVEFVPDREALQSILTNRGVSVASQQSYARQTLATAGRTPINTASRQRLLTTAGRTTVSRISFVFRISDHFHFYDLCDYSEITYYRTFSVQLICHLEKNFTQNSLRELCRVLVTLEMWSLQIQKHNASLLSLQLQNQLLLYGHVK